MHQCIKQLLQDIIGVDEIILETPKNKEYGHFATPVAFSLAKTLKQPPIAIAQEIAKKISSEDTFEKVDVLNGYINLTLSDKFLDSQVANFLKPSKISSPKKQKILLEYVSANPTGPLHIGHARGAVFGDSLTKIGRYLGYDITTEYYINDAGAQISMLGLSILLAGQEYILKQRVTYPENYYKGEYIIDIAQLAAQHFGLDIFDEKNLQILGNFGKDLMLKEIQENLQEVGIYFDSFVSEQSLYQEWNDIFGKLQKNKAVYEKDGKSWLNSQEKGDEKDRVIIRENKEPTYLAGDIIYHHDKFIRHYDHYINIWGADHHGYINRIKASLEFLNFDSKKLEIILAQMVSLLKGGEPYKMSKRAGNFILMKDVTKDIGSDSLRFIFLSKKLDTALEFDVNDLDKQDSSNPVFYINYANARIHTLFEKTAQQNFDSTSLLGLKNQSAKNLLFQAMQIQKVLENAFEERALQKVCEYLKNLAADFHSFYNAHKILGSSEEIQILKICKVVSTSLTLGLSLLGIKAKIKM
ncbi:arginine--tRNA ligase [Helicobacter anseris]|uniref:Arginine--tRNA ligase n=1 Tax=Helicobacter anseris TaxID=375926 RepID=A0A3D8JBC6_9HELI|nr:arginine--tRNA ligase [Helicobacter anseris]RDU74620.1 arginine--tRNA ligase [Helicobacter anseris]